MNSVRSSDASIPHWSLQRGETAGDLGEDDMNRRELVQAVAAHSGLEPRQVDTMLKSTTEVITAVVAKGEPVSLSGFAKFAKQERPARMGRNPATGEQMRIKASKKARITPLKAFKDAVMRPSQAPKLPRGVWPAATVGSARAGVAKSTATKRAAKGTTAATKALDAASKDAARKKQAKKSAVKKTTTKKALAKKR